MWLKDFRCQNCGSSLGKRIRNPHTLLIDNVCFVCEIGETELREAKEEAEDYPSVLERGERPVKKVSKILPDLHTPTEEIRSDVRHRVFADNDYRTGVVFEGFGDLSPRMVEMILEYAMKHPTKAKRRCSPKRKR